MKWLWLLFAGILPVLIAISKSRNKSRILSQFQYWHTSSQITHDNGPYSASVHFPSMLLRWHSDEDDWPELLHVRRNSNGTWEFKPTDRCNRIHLKRAKYWLAIAENKYKNEPEDHTSILSPKAEFDMAMESYKRLQDEKDKGWSSHLLLDASLETAYQKYIYAQNIPIVSPNWREEETFLEEKIDAMLREYGKSNLKGNERSGLLM